jgi:hypothetical protein
MGFWGALGTAAKTMQDKKQDDGGGSRFVGKTREFQQVKPPKKKKGKQKPAFKDTSV